MLLDGIEILIGYLRLFGFPFLKIIKLTRRKSRYLWIAIHVLMLSSLIMSIGRLLYEALHGKEITLLRDLVLIVVVSGDYIALLFEFLFISWYIDWNGIFQHVEAIRHNPLWGAGNERYVGRLAVLLISTLLFFGFLLVVNYVWYNDILEYITLQHIFEVLIGRPRYATISKTLFCFIILLAGISREALHVTECHLLEVNASTYSDREHLIEHCYRLTRSVCDLMNETTAAFSPLILVKISIDIVIAIGDLFSLLQIILSPVRSMPHAYQDGVLDAILYSGGSLAGIALSAHFMANLNRKVKHSNILTMI